MGWKSTKEITRNKALELIMSKILSSTDTELSNVLESLGFGDDETLPYYGYNFMIGNEEQEDGQED